MAAASVVSSPMPFLAPSRSCCSSIESLTAKVVVPPTRNAASSRSPIRAPLLGSSSSAAR